MKTVSKDFFYTDGKPIYGSEELAHKLVDVVNERQKHLNRMSADELNRYVKPCFESCGIPWIETKSEE